MFMMFAAMSTVLAVFENILAAVREITGWGRRKGAVFCGAGIYLISLTTALGYSVFDFHPFGEESTWLDFWDFIVSNNLLPIGALVFIVFCHSERFGWGWNNFKNEANAGKGPKVEDWMRPIFGYFVPAAIALIYILGIVNYQWT